MEKFNCKSRNTNKHIVRGWQENFKFRSGNQEREKWMKFYERDEHPIYLYNSVPSLADVCGGVYMQSCVWIMWLFRMISKNSKIRTQKSCNEIRVERSTLLNHINTGLHQGSIIGITLFFYLYQQTPQCLITQLS